jgi:hypothetical protein
MVFAARRAWLALGFTALTALLLGCGNEATALPETAPRADATPTPALPSLESTREPLAPPPPLPARQSAPTPAPAAPLDPTAVAAAAYRAWMEEARALHPYAESVEVMWAVMICESSGDAEVVGGGLYHGLFQYSAETWGGAWNLYRDQPILDPRAQIFATAKAWQDGNQSWWGCY